MIILDDKDKKELEKLIKDAKKNNPRKVVINLSTSFFKNPYLNNLVKLLINVGLFVTILYHSSLLKAPTSVYNIIIYSLIYTIIEWVLVQITIRRFSKYLLLSFSAILIIPIILAFMASSIIVGSYIQFISTESLLGFAVMFMAVRKLFTILLLNFISRRKLSKLIRHKEEN